MEHNGTILIVDNGYQLYERVRENPQWVVGYHHDT
jgi:hypothetical protein